jgi:hypothetical protein
MDKVIREGAVRVGGRRRLAVANEIPGATFRRQFFFGAARSAPYAKVLPVTTHWRRP